MGKIKKVLLVVPPGTSFIQSDGRKQCKECFPPLGLAYLAAQLIKVGYDVQVYDMVVEKFYHETVVSFDTVLYGATYADYRKKLEQYCPDLVGIQCMLSSRSKTVLNLCEITKEFNRKIYTILGGHHATALPGHVLQNDTDFVVLGEADQSFGELVNALNNENDISKIAGIAYKQNNAIVVQPRVDFLKNLDSLPFPAWDVVGLEKYWQGMLPMGIPLKKQKYGVVNTSRGCPHSCYYCAVPLHTGERNYRKRNLNSVINEIKWLVDTFGVEEIHFSDDNFFVGKERLKKLCQLLIDNFPQMNFAVPTGTDIQNVEFELIDLLKQAGFYHLAIGIETANRDFQGKYVDKKIDLT
ncbi:MAG: cobalamin-dependent protein, partial [Elusimicrobiota bacterium]